ncbi:MAG: hypothetical protein ACXVGA_03690 [Mycobacteriaceae bacterium]
MTITITRDLQIALHVWTAANDRARRDYYAHPNTACIFKDCDHLADDGYMCRQHHGLSNDAAAKRMRAHRRKVEHAAAQARYRARKETK